MARDGIIPKKHDSVDRPQNQIKEVKAKAPPAAHLNNVASTGSSRKPATNSVWFSRV
ncbi:hypothetical protein [Pontibacterium sinense]